MQFLYYIVVMIATYLLSQLLRPKPKVPDPAELKDFNIPQATEATPQCVFFADCWAVGGMVLGYGNFRTEAIESDGGKK